MTNHLLPVIGSQKLCALAQMSIQEQGKVCESIRVHLVQEDLGEQTYYDVRKALQLLLEAAQSYHLKFNYIPASLSSRIRMFNQQNRKIQQSFVPQHMDDAQRNRFFSVLQSQPDDGFALYIAGLIYSGLDYSDIPAIRFHMLQRIDLPQEHFYSILVDGRMYKNEKKFARRGILNEDCAFSVFCAMVLAPWAVKLLDRQVERFHTCGLTDAQIGKLPLSCQVRNLVDCDLRLNECTGLLWCNLHVLHTSQGKEYVLQITGQLNEEGYYIEYGKTSNAYRYIAVSQELGEKLVAKRTKMEQKLGHKLSLEPMCGYVKNEKYVSTPEYRKQYWKQLENRITCFLRTDKKKKRFYQALQYVLPKEKETQKINQFACMNDSLTPHVWRRNYCTTLYCRSGLPMEEIYQSMGHDPSYLTNQLPRGGKPEGNQCMLGLQKLVSRTAFHHQQPLRYGADGPYPRTEVPACDTILTVKKGQDVELCVYPTEPNTTVKMDTPAGTIQQENFVEMLQYQFTTALLAS